MILKELDRKCPKCNKNLLKYVDDFPTGVSFIYCFSRHYSEGYPLEWKIFVDPIQNIIFSIGDLFIDLSIKLENYLKKMKTAEE